MSYHKNYKKQNTYMKHILKFLPPNPKQTKHHKKIGKTDNTNHSKQYLINNWT